MSENKKDWGLYFQQIYHNSIYNNFLSSMYEEVNYSVDEEGIKISRFKFITYNVVEDWIESFTEVKRYNSQWNSLSINREKQNRLSLSLKREWLKRSFRRVLAIIPKGFNYEAVHAKI